MSSTGAIMFPCPCCGYLTMASQERGSFDVCPVCYWEDDRTQLADPTSDVGANSVSLEDARRNFREHGAISPRYRLRVRPPKDHEVPGQSGV
jgi:hypothetical protein